MEISSSFIQLKELYIAQIYATTTATTKNGIQLAIIPLIRRYHYDQMYNLKRLQGHFSINTLFVNMK